MYMLDPQGHHLNHLPVFNTVWTCATCNYTKNEVRAKRCVCGEAAPRTRFGRRTKEGHFVLVSAQNGRSGGEVRVFDVRKDVMSDVALGPATTGAKLARRVDEALDLHDARQERLEAERRMSVLRAMVDADNEKRAKTASQQAASECALCERQYSSLRGYVRAELIDEWRDEHDVPFHSRWGTTPHHKKTQDTNRRDGDRSAVAMLRRPETMQQLCTFCSQLICNVEVFGVPMGVKKARKLTLFEKMYRPKTPEAELSKKKIKELQEVIDQSLAPRHLLALQARPYMVKATRKNGDLVENVEGEPPPPLPKKVLKLRKQSAFYDGSDDDGDGEAHGATHHLVRGHRETKVRISELRKKIWETEQRISATNKRLPGRRHPGGGGPPGTTKRAPPPRKLPALGDPTNATGGLTDAEYFALHGPSSKPRPQPALDNPSTTTMMMHPSADHHRPLSLLRLVVNSVIIGQNNNDPRDDHHQHHAADNAAFTDQHHLLRAAAEAASTTMPVVASHGGGGATTSPRADSADFQPVVAHSSSLPSLPSAETHHRRKQQPPQPRQPRGGRPPRDAPSAKSELPPLVSKSAASKRRRPPPDHGPVFSALNHVASAYGTKKQPTARQRHQRKQRPPPHPADATGTTTMGPPQEEAPAAAPAEEFTPPPQPT